MEQILWQQLRYDRHDCIWRWIYWSHTCLSLVCQIQHQWTSGSNPLIWRLYSFWRMGSISRKSQAETSWRKCYPYELLQSSRLASRNRLSLGPCMVMIYKQIYPIRSIFVFSEYFPAITQYALYWKNIHWSFSFLIQPSPKSRMKILQKNKMMDKSYASECKKSNVGKLFLIF